MERTLGAADARFSDAGAAGVAILQDPDGEQHTPAGDYDAPGKSWPDGPTDVTKSIPAGSTVLTDSGGSAKLTTRHGLLQAEVRELAAADPVARGIMRLQEGRFPEQNDEIAATTRFLESSGLSVGSTLTARGFDRTYVISGSYELPSDLTAQQVNALPGPSSRRTPRRSRRPDCRSPTSPPPTW